jgi:ribonuclease P protein component
LLRSSDFARVERQGSRASGALLLVVVRQGRGRVGFAVSKKVGNAVVRNTVKRRLREIVRRRSALFVGVDVVVIAKPEAATASQRSLADDLMATLQRVPAPRVPRRR